MGVSRPRPSADAEGEGARPADLAGGPGHGRRVDQAELRNPLEPDLEGDPEFHACQVRAQAAVDAEPERGVPVDLAVDDDLIGAVELGTPNTVAEKLLTRQIRRLHVRVRDADQSRFVTR